MHEKVEIYCDEETKVSAEGANSERRKGDEELRSESIRGFGKRRSRSYSGIWG